MPDSPSRAPRRAWRILAVAGGCAVALAAAVAVTGGIDWSIGALRLRVHQPWRLLVAGVCLIAAASWLGGRQARAALSRAWDRRERYAPWIAIAAAATAMLVGLVKGTRVAGGADAYGYVSQALLWLKGLPVQAEPLAAAVPWPHADWSLAPLGFRPGLQPGILVPTYPPGLPLAMAAAAGIGGTSAVYWVVPIFGAAAVWLTYLLGRRFTDAVRGAAAAVLVAASPVFLYQLVQPMSDVPVTACWLLSLWGAAAGVPLVAGLGAAAAVLTRPNLAPLALLVTAAAAAHAYRQHRNPRAVLRAAIMCALPLAAAAGFLAWLNTRLYGSPFTSGYGAASELFALANVPVNAGRYIRWLLDTQTPIVLLGLAAPLAATVLEAGHARCTALCAGLVRPRVRRGGPGVLPAVLPFRGVVVPAVPPPGHSGAAHPRDGRPRPASRWPRRPSCACRWSWPASGSSRGTTSPRPASAAPSPWTASRAATWRLAPSPHERCPSALSCSACRRAARCGCTAAGRPCGSTASTRGASTRRCSSSNARGTARTSSSRPGRRPPFRERFAASSPLGLLDWPPLAEVGTPVRVRFYDPRDRQRFLAGESVTTAREPPLTPPRRVAPRIRRTPAG